MLQQQPASCVRACGRALDHAGTVCTRWMRHFASCDEANDCIGDCGAHTGSHFCRSLLVDQVCYRGGFALVFCGSLAEWKVVKWTVAGSATFKGAVRYCPASVQVCKDPHSCHQWNSAPWGMESTSLWTDQRKGREVGFNTMLYEDRRTIIFGRRKKL